MAEWGNPIFYLNFFGLVASIYLWVWSRGKDASVPLGWFAGIMTIGTGLHFIGDLIDFPEEQDHVFIHAVVLIGMAVLAIGAFRNRD